MAVNLIEVEEDYVLKTWTSYLTDYSYDFADNWMDAQSYALDVLQRLYLNDVDLTELIYIGLEDNNTAGLTDILIQQAERDGIVFY